MLCIGRVGTNLSILKQHIIRHAKSDIPIIRLTGTQRKRHNGVLAKHATIFRRREKFEVLLLNRLHIGQRPHTRLLLQPFVQSRCWHVTLTQRYNLIAIGLQKLRHRRQQHIRVDIRLTSMSFGVWMPIDLHRRIFRLTAYSTHKRRKIHFNKAHMLAIHCAQRIKQAIPADMTRRPQRLEFRVGVAFIRANRINRVLRHKNCIQ
mmetsp:Transcript_15049/g.22749  ORF Transcript_15049/g.22749 Transcript_15049/m.22749 type:complete len:205 (-) Transcript_15049:537-1151(-)